MEEVYESKVLPSSLHFPSFEKENFCSSKIGEEYFESEEDEGIILSTVIPRHLCLRMKKERFSSSQIIEESESEEDQEQPLPPTKIVIRHLPPGMEKDEFFQLVSPLRPHDYKYFAVADKVSNDNVYSTAYINFVNSDDALLFQEQFDGHIFQSSKGEKYEAVVEFASSQQVPKRLPSRNSFCGMIDDDPDYLEFLKSLKTPTTDMPKEIEVKKSDSKPADPLVDFVNTLRAKRIANGTYQPRKHNLRRQSKAKKGKNFRSIDNKYPNFQSQHFSENNRGTGHNKPKSMNSYFYCPKSQHFLENNQATGRDNKPRSMNPYFYCPKFRL